MTANFAAKYGPWDAVKMVVQASAEIMGSCDARSAAGQQA